MYEHDIEGELLYCRNGAHLINCHQWECQRTYKCPHSYCIPLRYFCDGVVDCPNGEDEGGCPEYLYCPGALKCRQGPCIHLSEVCDGTVHCPYGDDERMCVGTCPDDCTCYGRSVFCRYDAQKLELPVFTFSHTYLSLTGGFGNNIDQLHSLLHRTNQLTVIDVRNNSMSQFRSLEHNILDFSNLEILYISYNNLTVLKSKTFFGLENIRLLDISHNRIQTIYGEPFIYLESLETLNLSGQHGLFYEMIISDTSFSGLNSLVELDLSNNRLTALKSTWFTSIMHITHLFLGNNLIVSADIDLMGLLPNMVLVQSKNPMMCCIAKTNYLCRPEITAKSCARLASYLWVNPVHWVLGAGITLSNGIVFVSRWRRSVVSVYLWFILMMTVADFGYGVYLLFLAAADSVYGDSYPISDHVWRSHKLCKLAGVLSAIFTELSLVSSLAVACIRLRALSKVMIMSKKDKLSIQEFVFLTSGLLFMVCLVPFIFQYMYFWDTGMPSSACTCITLHSKVHAYNVYSFLYFGCLNLAISLCICIMYSLIINKVSQSVKVGKDFMISGKRGNTNTVLRGSLTIASNILVWLTVCLLTGSTLLWSDVAQISDIWHVTFVLAIHPLTNPLMYTLTTNYYK